MYRLLFAIIPVFFLSSCVVNKKDHGYEHSSKNFSELKINKSTKDEVINVVGSPSTNSSFNDDTWYYVTVKTEKISLLKPEVTGHKVTKLQFKNDVLSSIAVQDSSDKKNLKFNKAHSPINGDDSGGFKDFFHNLGRFNKNNKAKRS